ncbi:hypothetical protein [Micromonospora humida]
MSMIYPGFTPPVYTHLLPTSGERARRATDDLSQEPPADDLTSDLL